MSDRVAWLALEFNHARALRPRPVGPVDEARACGYTRAEVLGVDEFRLLVPEELLLRATAGSRALSADEASLARVAAAAIRFGLDAGDPSTIDIVRELVLQRIVADGLDGKDFGSGRLNARQQEFLGSLVEQELQSGRISVERVPTSPFTERRQLDFPELPPLPTRRETGDSFYELCLLDEIGQGIPGVNVEFELEGSVRSVRTNGGGVALLEGVPPTGASGELPDPTALERVLDPRWATRRRGVLPKESNMTTLEFDGAPLAAVALRAALRSTLVLTPRLGKLFVELLDKTGRAPHANQRYAITGPESFSGVTDAGGRLLHEGVLPGEYKLTLSVEVDLVTEKQTDTFETAVIALAAAQQSPQVRMLGALPRVGLARLKGMFFETNKSFLLPASVAVFDRLLPIYAQHNPSELLIVGHTDTTADAKTNDPLGLERAENTRAFLEDDVDAWLDMYTEKAPAVRRWAENEDDNMLFSMPDFEDKPDDELPLRWFQRTRGLKVDGVAGPNTRRQLIKEYMALDQTSLGTGDFDIKITTHGCGENFPLDDGGDELDAAPADRKEDQLDRRVELFFFDREFGILPPPPGKTSKPGSTQYPEWRRRAALTAEFEEGSGFVEVAFFLEDGKPLADERFEVVFPDGRVRTGRLDGDGRARVSGLANDDCQIRFPDLGDKQRVPPAE
jgi:outer membrane protein OmpA-like peptidoglycan-associated protein